MEKQYLIDSITTAALDTYYKRDILPESYRNVTVYCNQVTMDIIEQEIDEKSNGITYIQFQEKLKKAAEESGATYSVNGIKIKFEVSDEYTMLILIVDSLPPREEEE